MEFVKWIVWSSSASDNLEMVGPTYNGLFKIFKSGITDEFKQKLKGIVFSNIYDDEKQDNLKEYTEDDYVLSKLDKDKYYMYIDSKDKKIFNDRCLTFLKLYLDE
jgi:hypothetical protein